MAGLLTLGSAPDISNREWSYQLLSYLNGDQLPLQRHTPNLNFPIKSTPYTHIHTLTTLDTAGCKCGGSGQTQITPPKFRVIPAEPPTPTPQWPLVHSQQHLQMTGFETDGLTTVVTPL